MRCKACNRLLPVSWKDTEMCRTCILDIYEILPKESQKKYARMGLFKECPVVQKEEDDENNE